MTAAAQLIDDVVTFVRDHQPSFKTNEAGECEVSFYNRADELSKGSREYHDQMTKKYQEACYKFLDETSSS